MRCKTPLLAAFLIASVSVPSSVRADENERRITSYESEAREIGANMPDLNRLAGRVGQRRLVDAEVAFSLGQYNVAAQMLFELASQPGPDQERATFFLAESLFHRGDKGAARAYYQQIVTKNNTAGKYYSASLLRLVEVAVHQKDMTDISSVLAALNNISSPEVPYVKGKLAFSEDKFDEAIGFFNMVPKGSEHELTALYFTGVSFVAKKDVNRAAEIFTDIASRKVKTVRDKRVSELSHLALGRLYYEREQPSNAIQSYLAVDRRSDLFADALYEISWVYVKGKQYDKALRALELLTLSNPNAVKTPTARILEGNLRIRKARMLRDAIISGTIEKNPEDPSVEYDKAAATFAALRASFDPAYKAIAQIVDSNADVSVYLSQIANRASAAFETTPLPDLAIEHLREEPEVQRLVRVESDLGEIENDLKESESIIARLDRVLALNDKNAVYPHLQSRRVRIGQIQHDLIKIRAELHDKELALIDSSPELQGLTATRRQLVQQYLGMPNVEEAYATRVAAIHAEYDQREKALDEVRGISNDTKAMTTALRKHASEANPPLPDDKRNSLNAELDSASRETGEIDTEAESIQEEIRIGRDLAGVGDEELEAARRLRREVIEAENKEHRAISGSALGSSKDIQRSQALNALSTRAARVSDSLSASEAQIDALIEKGMAEVKTALETEKQNAATYRTELTELSAESRSLGSTVLGAGFKSVKTKFYDIVIRTDVGIVDVNWAQKEDTDDDLNRLRLQRQRELKQLKDEFKGILDGGAPKTPAPSSNDSDLPDADPNKPSGSPDKGQSGERVKPGGEKSNTPAQPVVKPDNDKPATTPAPPGTRPAPATTPRGGTR